MTGDLWYGVKWWFSHRELGNSLCKYIYLSFLQSFAAWCFQNREQIQPQLTNTGEGWKTIIQLGCIWNTKLKTCLYQLVQGDFFRQQYLAIEKEWSSFTEKKHVFGVHNYSKLTYLSNNPHWKLNCSNDRLQAYCTVACSKWSLKFVWLWNKFMEKLTNHTNKLRTPWKFNSSPLKIDHPKRKGSSSNYPFFRRFCWLNFWVACIQNSTWGQKARKLQNGFRYFQPNVWKTRWWQLKYICLFSPRNLGKMISNLTSIFFGWVGSTTNQF